MKKIHFITILTIVCAIAMGTAASAEGKFKIGLETGYFATLDEDFKDIYGSGGLLFGINASYLVAGDIEVYAAADLFSTDGETTISLDPTTLYATYARFGVFYHLKRNGFIPKIGAGIEYCHVKEESVFGDFLDDGIGWFIAAGIEIIIYKSLVGFVDVIYSDVSIKGDFGDQQMGGIKTLAGLRLII
jgi:outer membrane protein W